MTIFTSQIYAETTIISDDQGVKSQARAALAIALSPEQGPNKPGSLGAESCWGMGGVISKLGELTNAAIDETLNTTDDVRDIAADVDGGRGRASLLSSSEYSTEFVYKLVETDTGTPAAELRNVFLS